MLKKKNFHWHYYIGPHLILIVCRLRYLYPILKGGTAGLIWLFWLHYLMPGKMASDGNLKTWVSDKLMSILGYSQPTLVQYIIGLGKA